MTDIVELLERPDWGLPNDMRRLRRAAAEEIVRLHVLVGSMRRAQRKQEKQLRAVLLAYRQWEADLILTDDCWERRSGGLPVFTADLWARLLEVQHMREAALREAKDE